MAASDSSLAIRALAFNIRYASPNDGPDIWENRRDRVADLIGYYEADINGLQEVLHGQLIDLQARLPAYAAIGVGRDDGQQAGEYSPILYRTDRLRVLDQGTFWLSETPADTGSVGWDAAITRIVTWARFEEKDTGTSFYHFNTHFDHRGERARKESARLLTEQITEIAGEAPVIVTGDFNVNEKTDAYRILIQNDRRRRLRTHDALRDARREAAAGRTRTERTFSGFTLNFDEGLPIDHIFVKNKVGVGYYTVLQDHWEGRFPSDHRPVLADVQILTEPDQE